MATAICRRYHVNDWLHVTHDVAVWKGAEPSCGVRLQTDFFLPRRHSSVYSTVVRVCKFKLMATSVDKEGLRDAYQDVRADTSDTNWALFRYKGAQIVHDSSGVKIEELKQMLSDDERAFAFVRVLAGDEMSKRKKFVLLTWIGSSVSTLKRARVSIDKALVKQVVQNFAVELQLESPEELTDEFLRSHVDKVGGANYGTGM